MKKEHYYLLAFNSTHFAISAEHYLSKHIHVTIMPTLRKITASCGISIRIEPEDYPNASRLISSNSKFKNNSTPYEIVDEEVSLLSFED